MLAMMNTSLTAICDVKMTSRGRYKYVFEQTLITTSLGILVNTAHA